MFIKKFLVLVLLFFLLISAPAFADVTTTPSTGQCSSSDPAACDSFNQPTDSSSPSSGSDSGTSTNTNTDSTSTNSGTTQPSTNEHADFWSIVSGAIANPGGAANAFINMIVDMIASVFPSTPENLKIGSLIDSIGDSMPAVGRGIVREFFLTISICFGLVLIIKIYKLIPFKAT